MVINPKETGAIAPSSKKLSKKITSVTALAEKKCVVELGPGTGIFTKDILKKISNECVFFSLEINDFFVKETKKNCPEALIYHASAKDIRKYLILHNKEKCDAIISGLPWANFKKDLQEELLDEIYESLEEDGEFITFTYVQGRILPKGSRFHKSMKKKFKSVERTKLIWNNILPTYVYRYVK